MARPPGSKAKVGAFDFTKSYGTRQRAVKERSLALGLDVCKLAGLDGFFDGAPLSASFINGGNHRDQERVSS